MSDRDEDHGETEADFRERFADRHRDWTREDIDEYFNQNQNDTDQIHSETAED